MERPDCSMCEVVHERRGTQPQCGECTPPLMEENEDAVTVYCAVRSQVILAPDGSVVDINHLAIHEAMRLFNVVDQRECFRKVLQLAAYERQRNT